MSREIERMKAELHKQVEAMGATATSSMLIDIGEAMLEIQGADLRHVPGGDGKTFSQMFVSTRGKTAIVLGTGAFADLLVEAAKKIRQRTEAEPEVFERLSVLETGPRRTLSSEDPDAKR